VQLVSYKEFADRVGRSRPAISTATKTRLKDAVRVRPGQTRPMLDLERALELWNTGNQQEARSSSKLKSAAPDSASSQLPIAAAIAEAVRFLPDDAIPDLGISIERKEHYRAELAKVEAMQKREELVSTADVKRMASTLGRQIRDNILSIPSRVAPLLAAAQDSGEVHRLLSEELRTALRVLADG